MFRSILALTMVASVAATVACGQTSSSPTRRSHGGSIQPRQPAHGDQRPGSPVFLPPITVNPLFPVTLLPDWPALYWTPNGWMALSPFGFPGGAFIHGQSLVVNGRHPQELALERERAEARRPALPPLPPPAPPPAAKRPEVEPDDFENDAAMHRHLRSGNAAFALGHFQTALKHYEQAQSAAPLNPLPAFHLGQVFFAQGHWSKAAVALQRGLKWHPKWPESGFSVRALYGERVASFQTQLAKLAEAVEDHPNDDSLLFLLGYQLWFDGKRDDAQMFFKRAAALRVGSAHLDRFLRS